MSSKVLETDKGLKRNKDLKYQLDKLVDFGYINRLKHPTFPIYLYSYSLKAEQAQYWNGYVMQANGLILDKDGNLISKALPKILSYEETSPGYIPDEDFLVMEKIDGHAINATWYDNKLIIYGNNTFEDFYIDWTRKYFVDEINSLSHLMTVCCELVVPSKFDKKERVCNHKPGLYLIGATNKQGEDIDPCYLFFKEIDQVYMFTWSYPSIEWNEGKKDPTLSTEQTLEKFVEKFITKPKTEGWIIRFASGLRIEVTTDWYYAKRKSIIIRNNKITTQLSHGRTLDQIAETSTDFDFQDKIYEMRVFMDEKKLEMSRAYLKLALDIVKETSKEGFNGPIAKKLYLAEQLKELSNNRLYFSTAFNNQSWDRLLIRDAVKACIKNV